MRALATTLLPWALGLSACSVDSHAIPPGAPVDAGADALPDGFLPDGPLDAGPPCTTFAADPTVIAVIAGDDLSRTAGVSFEDTEIQEPGVIALAESPYRYGYWAFLGHEEPLLRDPPNLADLSGSTPVAAAFRDDLDVDVSVGEAPYDLLVTLDDRYTIEVIGEIALTAGDSEVFLDVDGGGVLSIDVDGTAFTIRQPTAGESSVTVTAPRDDFYPVHAAWQNEGGPGRFHVEVAPPGESRDLPAPSDMRVDASSLSGREVIGWESEVPDGDPLGSRIDLDATGWTSDGPPFEGVGITENDNWSARWFGRQVMNDPIDDVHVRSNESHRLWVDGVFLGRDYGGSTDQRYDTPAPDGIVDVVMELSDGNGGSELTYEVDDAAVAPNHLRPATRFGGTPFGVGERFSHSVSDTRTETLDLSGIPGGPPSAVEVSVIVAAAEPERVTVSVTEPGGRMDSRSLADAAWSRAGGMWLLRWVPPWAAELDSADDTWEITVDNAASDSVDWMAQGVLVHLGGVDAPYARTGNYQSIVLDLGDDTELTGVRAGGMWTGTTDVRFGLRASAVPAELLSMPFADTDDTGDLATPIHGRFVQVRLDLSGPGWDTPRIRDLRILGRACRRCAEIDPTTCPEERAVDGLVGLWRFDESGNVIRDLSGYRVHDLITPTGARIDWVPGSVQVETGRFTVDRPIDAITDAIEAANALTLEAWVTPIDDVQGGPARILTISEGVFDRNLTLGQDGTHWEGRIRRDGATNGNPFTDSADPSVRPGMLQHIVLTRTPAGEQTLWVDEVMSGDPVSTTETLGNWDRTFRLYVANESTDDRQWAGGIHLIALYARALSAEEIARHQRIGP